MNIYTSKSALLKGHKDQLGRLHFLMHGGMVEPLKIVVFGKYNHGKSSFLNAWLQQNIFKAADVRCTINVQDYHDQRENIIWTDTPGLDADEQDDLMAKSAITHADIVLLIHDAIAGELDKKELDFIKRYSKEEGKGKLRLLLTKIDQLQPESLAQVELMLDKQLGGSPVKLFPISSTRYMKYSQKKSRAFYQKSGFSALFPEIEQVIKNARLSRQAEVKNLCAYLVSALQQQQLNTQGTLNQLAQVWYQEKADFKRECTHLLISLHNQ